MNKNPLNIIRLAAYLVIGTISVVLALVVLWVGVSVVGVVWLLIVATGLLSFGVSAMKFSLTRIIYPDRTIIPTVNRERTGLLIAAVGTVGYASGIPGVIGLLLLLGAYYAREN